MSIILARIDDRLIHGQVTEGWGKRLKPKVVLVVSDEVAQSEWECELCLAALPMALEGLVATVSDAPRVINELENNNKPAYVLFETPHDAFEVIQGGAHITSLNVGGMHSQKGKREILDYIYVDGEDIKYLKALSDSGVKLDFRDVPDHEDVDVLSILH